MTTAEKNLEYLKKAKENIVAQYQFGNTVVYVSGIELPKTQEERDAANREVARVAYRLLREQALRENL